MARTAVLIPALNEEEALPTVLRALPRDRLLAVVVADNGSTDRTAGVARAEGALVVHEPERGYGAACLAGIALLRALEPPPEAVVFVDADHPESAERIATLLVALSQGADLVLGVRAGPQGATGNLRAHARWGNRLVLACARLLFGCRFRDLPPFRAVSLPALDRLAMDDRNWGWTLQMQLRAARLGLSVAEVEVPHRPRSQGRSKISGRLGMSIRVGAKMAATLVRERVLWREQVLHRERIPLGERVPRQERVPLGERVPRQERVSSPGAGSCRPGPPARPPSPGDR